MSLEDRVRNLDLDDPNEIWSALTAEERQKFTALIENGDAFKLLPSWNPWWTYTVEKKLIKDLSDGTQDKEYAAKCPQILCIPALKSNSVRNSVNYLSIFQNRNNFTEMYLFFRMYHLWLDLVL